MPRAIRLPYFGREIFYYEKKCLGKGDKRCLVVGIPVDDTIEDARNLKALYKVENIEPSCHAS
jgi:hypothetical protein